MNDEETTLNTFLNDMQKDVTGWIKQEKILMDDLPAVLRAYHLSNETRKKKVTDQGKFD